MENELKPCPFCGSDVKIEYIFPNEFVIVCENCGIAALPANEKICELDVLIDRWNRRVNDG